MVNFSDEAKVPNAARVSSPQPEQFPPAMGNTDDLISLLAILPQHLGALLERHPRRGQLIEVVLDLGRRAEARFPGEAQYLTETLISRDELNYCIERVGYFGAIIGLVLSRLCTVSVRSGIALVKWWD
jgi:hypothetical protein